MRELSVSQFRNHLRESVDQAARNHEPLRVRCREGDDFVVLSAADWDREQETLLVLQNQSLMAQIGSALETHRQGKGVVVADDDL